MIFITWDTRTDTGTRARMCTSTIRRATVSLLANKGTGRKHRKVKQLNIIGSGGGIATTTPNSERAARLQRSPFLKLPAPSSAMSVSALLTSSLGPAAVRGFGVSSSSGNPQRSCKSMTGAPLQLRSNSRKQGKAVVITRAAVEANKDTDKTSLAKPFEVRTVLTWAAPHFARALYRHGRGGRGGKGGDGDGSSSLWVGNLFIFGNKKKK